mgnify:CR=1 FL=1
MADLKNVQWALGDVVEMKKPHACKENQWQITRVGMDFRLKCLGCGRYVMLTRQDFKKRVKSVIKKTESEESRD